MPSVEYFASTIFFRQLTAMKVVARLGFSVTFLTSPKMFDSLASSQMSSGRKDHLHDSSHFPYGPTPLFSTPKFQFHVSLCQQKVQHSPRTQSFSHYEKFWHKGRM